MVVQPVQCDWVGERSVKQCQKDVMQDAALISVFRTYLNAWLATQQLKEDVLERDDTPDTTRCLTPSSSMKSLLSHNGYSSTTLFAEESNKLLLIADMFGPTLKA